MKVLGISGSPRKSQTTEELVKTILDATGLETEFISLHDMAINGCICCLGCIDDNVCKVRDDYIPLRKRGHTHVLLGVEKLQSSFQVPWLNGKSIEIILTT